MPPTRAGRLGTTLATTVAAVVLYHLATGGGAAAPARPTMGPLAPTDAEVEGLRTRMVDVRGRAARLPEDTPTADVQRRVDGLVSRVGEVAARRAPPASSVWWAKPTSESSGDAAARFSPAQFEALRAITDEVETRVVRETKEKRLGELVSAFGPDVDPSSVREAAVRLREFEDLYEAVATEARRSPGVPVVTEEMKRRTVEARQTLMDRLRESLPADVVQRLDRAIAPAPPVPERLFAPSGGTGPR